jgi:hypothetical protein
MNAACSDTLSCKGNDNPANLNVAARSDLLRSLTRA